jgi:AI-2E family transporter
LEIDDEVLGFVRGQATLCVILAVVCGMAPWLIGLKHGTLIGFASGTMSFVPYLGSLLGLTISTCIAITQLWPDWTLIALVPLVFFVDQSLADYVLASYLIARRVHLNPLDDIRDIRIWYIFGLHRLVDRGTSCSYPRRARALRIATVLCESAVSTADNRANSRSRQVRQLR